jgi:hypothetical protein
MRLSKSGYVVLTCPKCHKDITGRWSTRNHLMKVHKMRPKAATVLRNRLAGADDSRKSSPRRALNVRCSKEPVLTVERSKQWRDRMVYILAANKPYKYASGRRSRIIYIGTTGKGASRPATSAVSKASEAFGELHGVRTIDVHLATCRGRKRMRTWEHLESALLVAFSELHFELPHYNKKKGTARYTEDISLFRLRALQKLILQFAD